MNKWKVAFFVLSGLIIIFLTFIVFWATSPVDEVPIPSHKTYTTKGSVLLVETTAEDFEKIAMNYLSKELNNSSIPVDMTVSEQIELKSEMTAFGVTVPIAMKFDPIVNEDGNIHLKQTEVNVGRLNIPPSMVLKLMSESVSFPTWMVIRPEQEEIFVDLSNLAIASGSKVRAKEIDLANNRILLEVIVPNE